MRDYSNFYDSTPNNLEGGTREDGDLSIRFEGDKVGKALFEERERRNSKGKRIRDRLGLKTPGYKAGKLNNRIAQEEFLDRLAELQHDSVTIRHQDIEAAGIAFAGEAIQSFKSVLKGEATLSTPFAPVGAALNAIANVEDASLSLKQESIKKMVEYVILQNAIMKAERRDWVTFRESEQDRAYVSQNRLEWFFLGNALTGLHHSVALSIAEMDKKTAEAKGQVLGGKTREAVDIAGKFLDAATK